MFYIEENDKIVLFDESYDKLVDTIKFMPQYQDLEIQETDRPIVDFEFADTEEWYTKQRQIEQKTKRKKILMQLNELDTKRIRAICEGGENPETNESWLNYYNQKAQKLRQELYNITVE